MAASAARLRRGRPEASAASATAPIAAARTTEGCGRARTTKPVIATAARTGRARPRIPTRRPTRSTNPVTIARLAPLTAVRWVRPAVRKSSLTSAGTLEVSPTTSPGSSPRSAGGG